MVDNRIIAQNWNKIKTNKLYYPQLYSNIEFIEHIRLNNSLRTNKVSTFQAFFHPLICSFQMPKDQSKELVNPASSKVGEEQAQLPVDLLRWLITSQHSVQAKKLIYLRNETKVLLQFYSAK